MAITKKPKSNQSAIASQVTDRAEEDFISGAVKHGVAEEATT